MATTLLQTPAQRADALAAAPAAVLVDGVSKAFRLPHQHYSTLKERALHPFRSHSFELLEALRGVSVEIHQGEFFGIVGRNGSGKSTLLKCLAGIYDVDRGRIAVAGRLSPFIELGVGFNPDLTARDNVTINAIMLGLTRRQARARFDEIISFAELEDFVDLKLKNYSSGMAVRLAFSVAVQVDADVLLVDEVLAVGDASFQEKCFDQFRRLKEEGRTVLFVTHDMALVERFCDRAMLLHRGDVMSIGEPARIADRYIDLNFASPDAGLSQGGRAGAGGPGGAGAGYEVRGGVDGRAALEHGAREDGRPAGGPAEIVDAWFENAAGQRVQSLGQGEPCRACVAVAFREPVDDPVFEIALRDEAQHTVFAASSRWTHQATGRFSGGQTATVRIRFENWLAPSRYSLTPSVARAGGTERWDRREALTAVTIQGPRVTGGLADLPHTFEIDRP